MAPPPELAGVADVWMPVDRGPLGLPASVGPWKVREGLCDPALVNTGTLDTIEWLDRQDSCRLVVTDPSAVDWTVDCLRRVKTSGRRLGADSVFADSRTDTLHCILQQTSSRWDLELTGGFTEGWQGTLRRNGASFRVEGVRAVSGQSEPSPRLTGLWFFEGEQPRAALDLLKAGVFWVNPQLDEARIGPILGSGLAVLLYAGREHLEQGAVR